MTFLHLKANVRIGFDLTTSYYDKNNKKLICNGHSADFDKKGNYKILNLKHLLLQKKKIQ